MIGHGLNALDAIGLPVALLWNTGVGLIIGLSLLRWLLQR